MKPGILSTTALVIALGFTGSVTAQPGVNYDTRTQATSKRDRDGVKKAPSTQAPSTLQHNASVAAGIEINKQAIAAISQFLNNPDSPTPSSEIRPLQTLDAPTISPELPPLAAASIYLPELAPMMTGYLWPAQGVLSSGYGWRWGRMHHGIDIAGPTGTPILAAASGVVITAEWHTGGYGNLLEIEHSDGSITLYAHNDRILVNEGDQVEGGQLIAQMGSTGFSTGPHLHFEVHLPEQGSVNPLAYLPESGLSARLPRASVPTASAQ
ncbi:M23 family metallopeptidase [Phormidium pseudopriestleyi FRX01]|uniref:M23 family metallopeptidase n=1 Tax=Phormidium pseudopriestleyi FRX01 TaxID=1759528 RepID=A0ABS3FSL0_9CYAN|nr:M23 family metallopeptidase [Phormidium pseudopriestleyi]MBO0350103.1 M23 family metallopeptidase [Phormidium pseudopriestleyi FRX01]